MNEEKTKTIIEKYPTLFREYHESKKNRILHSKILDEIIQARCDKDEAKLERLKEEQSKIPQYHSIGFGFECDDGWYDLIDELCSRITAHDKEGTVVAVQIKEKFGGLRFYTEGTLVIDVLGQGRFDMGDESQSIQDLIHEYENRSYSICEVCGQPGRLCCTTGRWYKTVCKDHRTIQVWPDSPPQEYLPNCPFMKEEEVIVDGRYKAFVVSAKFNEEEDEWQLALSDGSEWTAPNLRKIPWAKYFTDQVVKKLGAETEYIVTNRIYDVEDGWIYNLKFMETVVIDSETKITAKENELEAVKEDHGNGYMTPKVVRNEIQREPENKE